jgi:glutathione synthase/RimK-type ligase-like ATP-grasp enzyme
VTAPSVGLVTCLQMPEADPDRDALLNAVKFRGSKGVWVAWDDPAVDWSNFHLIVIRSTWNYLHHASAFAKWCEEVDRRTLLLNPAKTILWNMHKSYLLDLAEHGFPVVPTELVLRGAARSLADVMDRRAWSRVVVKPAVGAGSFATSAFSRTELEAGERFFAESVQARDTLVQPYVSSVDGHGERAVVWIDGEITHAVRKTPRFSGQDERVEVAHVSEDEHALASKVLAGMEGLLYGRVDLVRDDAGKPMIAELELIEPSLFLIQSSAAIARFSRAIAQRGKALVLKRAARG